MKKKEKMKKGGIRRKPVATRVLATRRVPEIASGDNSGRRKNLKSQLTATCTINDGYIADF